MERREHQSPGISKKQERLVTGTGDSETTFVNLERNFGSGMITPLCPVKRKRKAGRSAPSLWL